MKTETIIFDPVVPYPIPVQIAELLTDIEAVIKRHVILSDHAAAALAVWVLHTYTFEMRDTVAYVTIESPEKRCGKTTLLSVLAAMASKPLIASNITVGALFRSVHSCSPTLFIDEADTFMAGNSTMRGIINSGNTRRTAYVLRLSGSKPSQPSTLNSQPIENTGLKKYSCWCPKVIAMIGEVPDTIADRSIVVKMARKLTTETCAPLSELDTAEIKAKCARFALDSSRVIAESPKNRIEGLNDRAADTFDPLYVIAQLAGDQWQHKLHSAALALSSTADIENSGAGLILDLLDIFAETSSEKMFSRDLVALLRQGRLKSQALKYSSINEYQISKVLRQYGIRPVNIRIGKEVHRGYLGSDFTAAVTRYVSVADREAHIKEIEHRWQLQAEASAEAERQQALREKIKSMMPELKKMPEAEAREVLRKLRNDQQTPDKCSDPCEQTASP